MITKLDWEFPLTRTHTGILQGNATMGAMIWGEGRTLRITIGRADTWDHRGGMTWTASQNYADIRRCLEANDEPGLRALFVTDTEQQKGYPERPSIIPVGRLDLGDASVLRTGTLDLTTGEVEIAYEQEGTMRTLLIVHVMEHNLLSISHEPDAAITVADVPAWDTLDGQLETISFPPPQRLSGGDTGGWIQELPADPAIGVFHQRDDGALWIVTARDGDAAVAQADAQATLEHARANGFASVRKQNCDWWKSYWSDVPTLDLPNDDLEEIYAYGMYKFAGFSQPAGVAGGLQGPWIEEYRLPPWSSDYHFNINVQMCYWPAFKGNRLSHLVPLFDLIFSWEDTLRQNAKLFIGIDDGLMLPHAVDDRCTCMGSFWTGCIDHGCTAWVAQMMYDYATYSGDTDFLRDKAFPFMKGAMRVYEAMLERDGDEFTLPVSVSPEYGGDRMTAWGANASFQLACIHRLVENLQEAAGTLDEAPSPAWQDIAEHLPRASLVEAGERTRIGLWDGNDLEQSHRHHSHLAGICPFDTIDMDDPDWKDTVAASFRHWVWKGLGEWSGWCVPWASMLNSRYDRGDAAEVLLAVWKSVYTNEGRGTLHDCDFAGITVMGSGEPVGKSGGVLEIMQIEAGFGAVVAVQDMMMHTRRGVHHIFAGVPRRWKDCSFDGMLTAGGFLLSGRREHGQTQQLQIRAQRDGSIRVANPWDGLVTIESSVSGMRSDEGAVITLEMSEGETVVLQCADG